VGKSKSFRGGAVFVGLVMNMPGGLNENEWQKLLWPTALFAKPSFPAAKSIA